LAGMEDSLIAKLCKRYHIEFFDFSTDWEGELPSYGIEGSSCCTRSKHLKPLIQLGVYQDPEIRLLSFFHELGHIVDRDNRRIPEYKDLPYYHFNEASAWRMGLRLAFRNGVEFSQNALDIAKRYLATYFEDDNMERTPLKYLQEALDYAFVDERIEMEKALA